MSVTIVIPDFNYTAHFYPEFLEDLTQYLRANCPELTDEDPAEPHMQLIRAFALGEHLNSVLLDMVANEMYLTTAKLRSSHKALLKLIDVELAQASPASTELVSKLATTFAAARLVVPAKSLFATVEGPAAEAVEYECLDDVNITLRTDQVGQVYSWNDTVFTDNTAEARTDTGDFTPTWALAANDALYIGHPDVMFDQVDVVLSTGINAMSGVWEYFDGNYDQGKPLSVTNLGSTLEFNVNSILGTSDRRNTIVRVRSAITGAYQDIVSTFSGGANKITTSGTDSFLGQSAPSTSVSDYIVGSAWRELSDITDGTGGLATSGALEFTLPQSVEQSWSKTTVGTGGLAVEGFWLRFRIISVTGGAAAPDITQILIDQGDQYLLFSVTQGHSRVDNPLGTSDGTPSQVFTFSNLPVLDDDNIEVIVDEGTDQTYTRVDNFLNSVPTDRHYTLEFDDDGGAVITFGDGTNGKIPPAGANNIRSSYRTMDEINGNVGAQTITVNRSGVAFLADVTNPRAATGFDVREGSTDEDLARIKISGPASLRARKRAVTTDDVEVMAKEFIASDGQKVVKRALAIEEAYGPKTVEVVVVGAGGAQVEADKLAEIEEYYNGDDDEGGVLVLNNEATATNFTQRTISPTLTLTGGNVTAVLTALVALLNPLATEEDGTYTWEFGGEVALAKLIQTVMNTEPRPTNVAFSLPAADVALGVRELPTVGTVTINGDAFTP